MISRKRLGALARSDAPIPQNALRKFKAQKRSQGQWPELGRRRQSSSSAGVSVGLVSGRAVGERHRAGRGKGVARLERRTTIPSSPRASGSAARAAGNCGSLGVLPILGV